jgi:hypothetical protein
MERRGDDRRKPSETAFDFGRSEAGSNFLIAGRRPPSAPSDSIEFGRNPYSTHWCTGAPGISHIYSKGGKYANFQRIGMMVEFNT